MPCGWTTNTSLLQASSAATRRRRPSSRRASASSASTTTTGSHGRAEARPRDGVDVVAVVTPNDTPLRDRKSLPRSGHLGGVRKAADQRLVHGGRARRDRRVDAARSSLCPTSTRPTRWFGTPPAWSAMAISDGSGSSPQNTRRAGRRLPSDRHQWRMDPAIGGRRHAPSPTSAPTPFTYCATSPDWKPPAFPPNSARWSRTTGVRQRDHPAHAVQRRACHACGRRWRPPATSTACASGCSATTRAWNGATRIRST